MSQTEVDLVLSGSGTLIPCHLGAIARLQAGGYKVRRIAGTSGGAIVAAGIAHGFEIGEMLDLCRELLRNNKMLDLQFSWWRPWRFFKGYGLHGFDIFHKEIRTRFDGALAGRLEDAEMEWGVFVADLETRQPVFLHSKRNCHVSTPDAVVASASIPIFAQARRISGANGLFVDGGLATNFGLGVWDDNKERQTIGIRFKSKSGGARKAVTSFMDFTKALLEIVLELINRTHISSKRYAHVVEIRSDGDSLDFSLTDEQITDRYQEGWDAAEAWLEK
jgi:NTE family protein